MSKWKASSKATQQHCTCIQCIQTVTVKNIVRAVQKSSVQQPSGVPYKVYRHCPRLQKRLLRLIRAVWLREKVANQWSEFANTYASISYKPLLANTMIWRRSKTWNLQPRSEIHPWGNYICMASITERYQQWLHNISDPGCLCVTRVGKPLLIYHLSLMM